MADPVDIDKVSTRRRRPLSCPFFSLPIPFVVPCENFWLTPQMPMRQVTAACFLLAIAKARTFAVWMSLRLYACTGTRSAPAFGQVGRPSHGSSLPSSDFLLTHTHTEGSRLQCRPILFYSGWPTPNPTHGAGGDGGHRTRTLRLMAGQGVPEILL